MNARLNELYAGFVEGGGFYEDYRQLRIAVCQLESVALDGATDWDGAKRFCTGGGGDEPANPPKPPGWG